MNNINKPEFVPTPDTIVCYADNVYTWDEWIRFCETDSAAPKVDFSKGITFEQPIQV